MDFFFFLSDAVWCNTHSCTRIPSQKYEELNIEGIFFFCFLYFFSYFFFFFCSILFVYYDDVRWKCGKVETPDVKTKRNER